MAEQDMHSQRLPLNEGMNGTGGGLNGTGSLNGGANVVGTTGLEPVTLCL